MCFKCHKAARLPRMHPPGRTEVAGLIGVRMTAQRHLTLLIALALIAAIGPRPEARARQVSAGSQGLARCSGDYAPGSVLVGLQAPKAARLPELGGEQVLGALLQERGWREREVDVSGEILSFDTKAVHALRVPIGRECAAVEALRRAPDVAFAELDYAVHATGVFTPDDPGWVQQWGPAKIDAPSAWAVTTGTTDVIVAIVDTGIELDHPDLVDNLWINAGEVPGNGLDDDGNGKVDDLHGWHFYDGDTGVPGEDGNVADDYGHGTHVAGIAGARINNALGVAGMAGGSRLMAVKALDSSGNGYYSDLAQGIVYAVDNGARIINLSLGGEPESLTLQMAVDYAHARGALMVAAAGNYGGPVLYPGACEQVLTVSGSNQDDSIRQDASHGPEVEVAAPGTSIYSTQWSLRCPSGYCTMSGTSTATPHVAGLAALAWSVRPDLTSAQVTQVITTTASDVNGSTLPGRDEYMGWGRIEAGRAISVALSLPENLYDVEMAPPTATVTAALGASATYTLTVRNTGDIGDAYVVRLGVSSWETVAATDLVGPLDPDLAGKLQITVTVPPSARGGMTDTVDVTVRSAGYPAKSAISRLTTTATGYSCYLSLMFTVDDSIPHPDVVMGAPFH